MASDSEHQEPRPEGQDSSFHVASMRELAGMWVQYQSAIAAYITANVADMHHAEDLVQEVAQVVAEKFSTYDRERSFLSWALGIARNRLLKYYRTKARDRLVLSEAALTRLGTALERVEGETEDRREALKECLQEIQGRRREVLELRYRHNARVTAIASQFGMSTSAVSVMLYRIRAALFSCVQRKLARQRT
jgi:RNA polymerase sigma-70 factor, ECF subfamily